VLSPGVIEPFNAVEHLGLAFISGAVNPPTQSFGLQCGEEALHDSIIPAVATLAHAAHDPGIGQQHLELLAGVLAALLGMVQDFAGTATPIALPS